MQILVENIKMLSKIICIYNMTSSTSTYTAKSQYWLHEAGASPEHWQIKINN